MKQVTALDYRVGNILDSDGSILTLTAKTLIWELEALFTDKGTATKPIAITEEWLKRLGFVQEKVSDDDYEGSTLWVIPHFGAFYLNKLGLTPRPYYFADAFAEDLKILYVHQLQNIYHALTGMELIIQPK